MNYERLQRAPFIKEEHHRVISCNNFRNMKGGFLKRVNLLIPFIPLNTISMCQLPIQGPSYIHALAHHGDLHVFAREGAFSALKLLEMNAKYLSYI